jgi:hypothetical protein
MHFPVKRASCTDPKKLIEQTYGAISTVCDPRYGFHKQTACHRRQGFVDVPVADCPPLVAGLGDRKQEGIYYLQIVKRLS